MAKIIVENLTKRFGALTAVDNLNLEVKDSEFVCLLGPSGCGKTTTLRCIAGLDTPTSGNIYFGNELVNDLTPAERDVAMVFQFYALYPSLTVYENLAFPLKAVKMAKEEIDRRIKETADILHISNILNVKSDQLTPGEAQRTAIGRAIVRRPKLYLLDEPLTNLDAKLRAYMRAELKKLQKELGQTAIYVTHDQLEAMTMADRIAVMNLGVLQQYDQPENIYGKPKSLFVAGFIGSPSMNFIDCSLQEKKDKIYLDSAEFQYDISYLSDFIGKESSGSEMIIGFRPEDLTLHSKKPAGFSFEGEVYVVEPTGDQMIVSIKAGRTILKSVTPQIVKCEVGDHIWLSFKKDKAHIIDKKSGKVVV